MKKVNKKYLQIGAIALVIALICIAFDHYLDTVSLRHNSKNDLGKIMLPILDGLALAYFLNPVLKFVEKKLIGPLYKNIKIKDEKKKIKQIRGISVAITIVFFLLIVAGLILLIVPQLLDSIQSIITRFPSYLNSFNSWSDRFLVKYPQLRTMLDNYWENITDYAYKELLPRAQTIVSNISSTVVGSVFKVLSVTFKFIIGIILSVYLLYSKETYQAQSKKMVYSLLDEERANNLINNLRFANRTFGGYISGKIVDSIIIGFLCFIGTTIMNMPYALLISVIVGVTNVIPFFGPYLGAIPSGFIILMINPIKCLWFLLFILILQQIDGNIIGPKILGDSTGLSSFWVIFAITLFGGFFKVLGMFLGVPIFAIIYAAIKTFVDTRLERKKLPSKTYYYIDSDYHSDKNDPENTGETIRFINKAFSNVSGYGNNLTDATLDLEFEDGESEESAKEEE